MTESERLHRRHRRLRSVSLGRFCFCIDDLTVVIQGITVLFQAVLGLLDGLQSDMTSLENVAVNVMASLSDGEAKATLRQEISDIRDRYDRFTDFWISTYNSRITA